MAEALETREQILEQLKVYLEDLFEIEPDDVTLEADLAEDLDLDSIDAVDLMVKVQEVTGKKVAPEEFKTVRSIGDVVDRVHALVNRKVN